VFPELLEKLRRHEDLSTEEAARAMGVIMDGNAQPSQIAALLVGLTLKGERPTEVVGFATAMRQRATPLPAPVGPVFDTCLHEFGHAIFDMLKVPVFGREEDAADQVAAYFTLQLGKDEARRQIGGTAYAYMTEAKAAKEPPALEKFANEHGTPAQRFYNLLCIAYGADAKLFGDLVAKGYLPKERAEGCADEYTQVAFAFNKLLGPHIYRPRAKKVLQKSWLPTANTPVPHRH